MGIAIGGNLSWSGGGGDVPVCYLHLKFRTNWVVLPV